MSADKASILAEVERKLGISIDTLLSLDDDYVEDMVEGKIKDTNNPEVVTELKETYYNKLQENLKDTGIKLKEHYYTLGVKSDRESVTFQEEDNISDVSFPCKILLDQSTNTGFAIYDSEIRLVLSGELTKKSTTSVTRYSYVMEQLLNYYILKYDIDEILHEEVYDQANRWTTEVLHYIKHKIKDIEVKRELEGNNKPLTVYGVDHTIWKKHLAEPNKFKAVKGKDKEEVKKYVSLVYPLLFEGSNKAKMTEDMVDAIGMGIGMYLKQTFAGKMYNKVRYDKKLPIDEQLVSTRKYPILNRLLEYEGNIDMLSESEVIELGEMVKKLRKPFRDAYDIRGLELIDLPNNSTQREITRRYLTYTDCIAVVHVTKKSREWGLLLLRHGVSPSGLENDDHEFYILTARRRRRI